MAIRNGKRIATCAQYYTPLSTWAFLRRDKYHLAATLAGWAGASYSGVVLTACHSYGRIRGQQWPGRKLAALRSVRPCREDRKRHTVCA